MTLEQSYLTEMLRRISGVDPKKCMKCGKCSASCPAYQEMEYHPHQFVSMLERGRVSELIESDAYMKCVSCFTCAERCPRSVDPSKVIEAARVIAIRRYGRNRLAAHQIPALVDDDMPQQVITSAFRKFAR